MSTQERDPNASGGSSPPEDRENSGASGNKGSQRWTRQTVIKRSAVKHAATRSQDDSMDDFCEAMNTCEEDYNFQSF
jgi:hypothetical protein